MAKPRNAMKPRSRYGGNRGTVGARNPILDLPATGCDLPVPPMPKGRDWSEAERERWADLWGSPQACAWDDTATGTVAALIVFESALFDGTASAWQAAELRHAGEALGLTPRAMGQLGWRITE